jgi:carbon-monoxide dehydrogenase large subunit
MSATGVGAPVRRKEDQRFITGLGHYTDDLTRPGQTYAVFVRSPHAHAKIKKLDTAQAARMPGVVGILTGKELAADKLGGLICGWMVLSKDGSPMKAAPHPALAVDAVRYVGDHVAIVIAETYGQAKDAAEKVSVDYQEMPAVTDGAAALRPGAPQVHAEVPGNLVYDWVLGEKAATDAAFKSAAHVTRLTIVNNRLIPNAMEPRAAIGEYDAGNGITTLWTTSQNPHVARLVLSAFIQLAPEHKLPAAASARRSLSMPKRRSLPGRRARSGAR